MEKENENHFKHQQMLEKGRENCLQLAVREGKKERTVKIKLMQIHKLCIRRSRHHTHYYHYQFGVSLKESKSTGGRKTKAVVVVSRKRKVRSNRLRWQMGKRAISIWRQI